MGPTEDQHALLKRLIEQATKLREDADAVISALSKKLERAGQPERRATKRRKPQQHN